MIGTDLVELWIFAIVMIFAFLFFGSASIDSSGNTIVTFGGIALVLSIAIVVTIGLFVGFIGVW